MEIKGAFQGFQPARAITPQAQAEPKQPDAEKSTAPVKQKTAIFTPSTQATDKTAQTLFYAQTLSSNIEVEQKESKGVEAFREYMSKTPEERWREQILADMGLTEESLRQLPAEEQQKIEEKIRQIIEAKIEEGVEEGRRETAIERATNQNIEDVQDIDETSIRDIDLSQIENIDPNVAQLADLPQELQNLYEQVKDQELTEESV